MSAPALAVVEQGAPHAPLTYPTMPQVIEAEQAVLGSCIMANRLIPQMSAIVTAKDFFDPLHQRIWTACLAIDGEQRPVTALTLRTALGQDPAWTEISWQYLCDVTAMSTTERECRALAHDVASTALRRRAMQAIWEAQEELSDPPQRPITEILAPVVRAADEAAERVRGETDPSVSECAHAFLRELETGESARPAFVSGMDKMDGELGGFFPSDLVVIGGRPGMCKSALLTCLARAAARGGARVDLFSIEMSRRDNVARILCDIDYDSHPENPLWYSKLMRGRVNGVERGRAAEASVALSRLDIAIHDSGSMTMPQIASLSRARASRFGRPAMVAIDHLQIVRATSPKQSRYEIITEASAAAKALAKQLECPVVLLSQLSRGVEARGEKERMPTLADLRESGSIEQDADIIVMLYRPAFYVWQKRPRNPHDPKMVEWQAEFDSVKNRLEISVPKHRHGAMFDCTLYVEPGASAIRDDKPMLRQEWGEPV